MRALPALLALAEPLALPAAGPPAEIVMPGPKAHPESITATRDGTLYVGSVGQGGVWRVVPGRPPERFVPPGGYGTANVFGVLADESRGRLWVCSNDWSARGAAIPGADTGAPTVKAFDLKSGRGVESHALDAQAMCNDMAIGGDGTVYVTDTQQPRIFAIRRGRAPELWLTDPRLQPSGPGLDGIAFTRDGNLLVNTLGTGELFRIAVKRGRPGAITPLTTSSALVFPDALRPAPDGTILLTEGGRLDRLHISGDRVRVEVLREAVEGSGVAVAKGIAWVAQGRVGELRQPRADAPPFRLVPVPLP